MILLLVLLLLSSYVTFALARVALIAWQVQRVAEGKRTWPISFSAERIMALPGDTPILALGADRWEPGASRPPAPHSVSGTSRHLSLGRHGITIGRTEWRIGRRGVERRVEGRTRRDRGWLFITDRHIGWRGRQDTIDVPLTDVAHLEVRRPLLEIRRHSRPNEPLLMRLAQGAMVAQLIAVLSARAMGYTVTLAGRQATGARRP